MSRDTAPSSLDCFTAFGTVTLGGGSPRHHRPHLLLTTPPALGRGCPSPVPLNCSRSRFTATRSRTLRASEASDTRGGHLANELVMEQNIRGRTSVASQLLWGSLGVWVGLFFSTEFQFQKITVICQRLSPAMSFCKGPSSGPTCLQKTLLHHPPHRRGPMFLSLLNVTAWEGLGARHPWK